MPEAILVANFLSRVSVEPVKNSRLVDISFVSANPEFAATAVNQLAREYVDQNAEQRRSSVTSGLSWIEQELERQKAKVEASERAMASYREEQNAGSLEDRQNIVVARLNQLNDVVTKAKTTLVQKESLYNQVKSLSPGASPETIPAILQNQYIQSLKTQVAELERDRANLSERYGDRHPEIIKVNASIKDATRQLELELAKAIDAIRNDYQAALAEERALAGSLEEQKGAAMSLGRKSVSYTVLEREAQSNRQVYENLLSREKELQVLAQQPRQQRPPGRGRRGAGRSVHAEPAAHHAPGVAGRPDAGGGAGGRAQLSRRHGEDAGRHHGEAEGAVPRHDSQGARGRIAGADRRRRRTSSAKPSARCAPRWPSATAAAAARWCSSPARSPSKARRPRPATSPSRWPSAASACC